MYICFLVTYNASGRTPGYLRLILADLCPDWISNGKKSMGEKSFKFTFKNNKNYINPLRIESKATNQPPRASSLNTTVNSVLGCSKVFVATMCGELCAISFHISFWCTLVVSTTQGFNPKAKPMTSGKTQVNQLSQPRQQTIQLTKPKWNHSAIFSWTTKGMWKDITPAITLRLCLFKCNILHSYKHTESSIYYLLDSESHRTQPLEEFFQHFLPTFPCSEKIRQACTSILLPGNWSSQ